LSNQLWQVSHFGAEFRKDTCSLTSLGIDIPLTRLTLHDVNLRYSLRVTTLNLAADELRRQSGKVWASGTLGTLRQLWAVSPTETIADLFGFTEAFTFLPPSQAETSNYS